MQIETIILNTSLIEVAEKSIPDELIKTYTNSTVMCNQDKKISNDSSFDDKFPKFSKEHVKGGNGKRGKFAPYFNFDLDSSKSNFNRN